MTASAWIPIAAWIAAVVIVLLVLGFCAYEILWKTKRLRADLARLEGAAEQLSTLRRALVAAQERLATTGLR